MKTMKWFLSILLGLPLFCCISKPALAAAKSVHEITVAAAADLNPALKEIAEAFEKSSGIKVRISYGASGILAHQIENRAPFDVFLSADMDFPRDLISKGDAEQGSLYRYATGKLILWVPADSSVDVQHGGMSVLANPALKRIAIANPDRAPYGRAAVAAMKHVQIYDRLLDRMVVGESVAQAAEFVESGNAQAGFIPLSFAMSPAMQGKGKYWIIPSEAYPSLDQGAVLISHSRHKKEAQQFLAFMRTKMATDILEKYGFVVP